MKIKELAELLDISPQMVGRLKKDGMPTDNLEVAIAWRNSHQDITRQKGRRIDGNTGIRRTGSELIAQTQEVMDFNESKATLEYYKALQAKADYEQSIGDLVPRDEINRSMTSAGIIIREAFERMPDFLGEELFAAESAEQIKEILAAHINESLEQAAENLGKYE